MDQVTQENADFQNVNNRKPCKENQLVSQRSGHMSDDYEKTSPPIQRNDGRQQQKSGRELEVKSYVLNIILF